nr:SDR family NAD(P)-dependent oxidoreductase [Ilumatobacteraceae bacterium]
MPDTEPASDVRGSSDEALRRALLALKDLRARAERAEGAATEPIAIIGIGCRFPAGANSPAEYWDLLRSGRDGVGTMPDGRWDREAYFDPDPEVAGKIYTDQGGFLDQPIDTFDAAFFGIAPVEARDLDPQQRLLLEVTWEALEHAGVAPDRLTGSATGVFVGMSTFDYSNLVRDRDPEDMGTYSGTGVSGAVAAGRLSYVLGLRGPAMCLDTACSSSLVALSLATQSLRAGACRMALAGGVNLVLDPQAMISLSLLRALSATGRCHTFGAEADGYARGEGAGMVVLKRLSDAQADGDRILAVVRSAAVNHDGRSSGLTVPSGPAQREVIERALTEAGLQPADVDLVEAHGTGTHLGDPIEVRALDAVYSRGRSADHPLLIGSAKTNIGHLEAAAGIAGVIKTVLALQHEEVPPHLHCEELSPHIAWSTMPIEVTRELRPWPRGERARRGAVSAFGFSGTNAHVILEEAPLAAERGERTPTPVVITLSARDDAALATLARATGDALADADLADLAWTLQDGRALLRRRLAVTASTTEEAADRLRSWDPAQDAVGITTAAAATRPRVAFVFTGQGAQLPRMGRDLYEQEPVFRAALDECDVALRPRLEHALIDVLYGDDDLAGLIHHTQYTQPAMFALQYGLTALWRSWGITPDVVVGHSIGEYAAAVAAGVMDVSTAVDLIAARGALMGALPSGGKMVAVFADEARVAALIAPHSANVSIAANNGASSVVISGEGPSIDMILADLDGASIRHRALEVSHAFHSPLMSPMVAAFDEHTRRAVLREPTMTFVSTVSGVAESALIASPAYWRDQVLATVRFGAAIDSIVGAGIEQFLEIGPQPTLLGMIARIRGSEGLHASLRPATGAVGERSDRAQMLDALGGLWAAGREPNWRAIDGGRSVKVDAPTYPFQRQRHWIDPPRHRSHSTGGHPLLGVATHAPTLGAMIHESTLSVDSPAWLDDHRLAGIAVLPGSAFAEMALAAADSSDTIESLNIHEALVLPANGDVTVQTIVTGPANRQEVQILSLEPGDVAGGGWKVHATATMLRSTGFATGNEPLDLGAAVAGFDEDLDVGAYYAQLQSVGLMYGPTFRGVTRLLRRDGAALGHVRLPPSAVDARRYRLHPALLDACFHVLGAAIAPPDLSSDDMFVPVAFEGVRVGKAGASSVWCAGTLIGDFSSDARSITARIEIFDDSGSPVGSIDRLVARRTPKAFWAHAAASAGVFDDLYEVAWRPQVRPQVAAQDVASMAWVIIADDEVSAGPLVANLLGAGAAEVSVQAPFDADRLGQLLGNGGGTTGVVSLCTTDGAVVGADRALVMAETVLQQPLAVAQALAARSADDTRLWFVTRGAHSVDGEPPDVVTSLAWGLARTVANEQPQLGCVCIDIDAGGGDDEYDELALELIAGAIDTRAPEDQVALRGRRRSVARLVRHDVGLHTPPKSPYRVTLAERGSFDQLSFATLERRSPLDGEVEIEVRASGINFRDVLNVLGMYPGNPGLPGLECAGIVTAVGSGVRDLAVGDAVFGIAPQAFDSHVVTQADLVVLKPSTITFAEAATLPIAFLTAEYGLSTLAGLQRGETVLIHAAAGGVGMAAVSLAQRLGAEVFATVGSARKRRTLEALGVTHIYDSRTLDFAEQILADTDGKGVDVVLNSLADEFIDRSFRSLAQAGRFLEIGKRGIWSAEQAAAVRPKGRYHVYDLSDFFIADRNGVQVSLQGVADGIADGSIAPLPLRAFSIQAIRDAFRFVAQARHIGKVVLTHRAHGPLVRDDGAYVVTGGLGGIGLEMASWLVEQGARHLTLTGRSSPSADAERAIEVMASRGATVTVVQGDIAVASDVQRVLSAAAEGGVALRGVFHAAGVLDDGVLAQQSWSRFAHVLAPKLLGALLLDEATRDADLDHFVLFSSAAAVLGSPGQANYVAANTALDTLARRRRATGRTALSINWGAWAEVGMAARLQVRDHERLADRGIGSLSTAAGLDALERLLLDDAAQVAVMSMDWARLLGQMGEADRPVLLSELAAAATRVVAMESGVTDDGGLPAALEAAAPLLRRSVSVNYVTRNLVRVLGLPPDEPIDGDQDLAELGLDSLMSVELTNRLRSGTGLSLPASLPYDHPSIHRLADHLLGLFGDVDALADLAPTRAAAMAAVVPVDRGSPLPASSAQARLLFVDRLVPGLAIYNIPVALRLRGELDVGALRSSVMSLVDRHEALRTNFVLSGERYMQQIVPTEDAVVPFVIHTDPVDPAVIDDVLREEAARPFDLVHDAKLRAALY